MDANIWGERWSSNESVLAREWMRGCVKKQSLVVLAADKYDMEDLNQLLELVSPYVVALKTHVDLVTDWTPDAWGKFCNKAKDAGMLIFEDRKFADIGNTNRLQALRFMNLGIRYFTSHIFICNRRPIPSSPVTNKHLS